MTCPAGKSRFNGACKTAPDPRNFGGSTCPNTANTDPINVGIGNTFEKESDLSPTSSNNFAFYRSYNSMKWRESPTFGQRWGNSWNGSYDRGVSSDGTTTATVYRPDGKEYTFTYASATSQWLPSVDISSTLIQLANSAGWSFKDADAEETEAYSSAGKLQSITTRDGYTQTLTYTDGTNGPNGGYALDNDGNATTKVLPAELLLRVTDSYGRQLSFGYDVYQHVVRMVSPNGDVYRYHYDTIPGNLDSVTYPDGHTRTYVYNETANSGANLANALTGIIDENGNRFTTWKYDAQGRAISSEHDVVDGTTTTPVEKVSIAYNTDTDGNITSADATDALRTTRTYTFTNILGVVKNTGITQACNCGAPAASTYDTNGNVASRTDFNGNTTCYAYDQSRNLELFRVEGLAPGKSCPADLSTYTPAANTVERKIATTWDTTYRLPHIITEAGKTATFNYDASGNLLSKTITDTALNKSRTWSWTYNSLGQVLTADGPRTDVNDVTTYQYYDSASTTAGSVHAVGDLASITNAAGLVTQITNYDGNGRPLTVIDPNNVVTTLTYSPRGWLTSRTVNGAQTTTYGYDGVGQLVQITLPDNSALQYTYDTAHRLTDIADGWVTAGAFVASGNKIHYTLDAMGNRTAEDTQDPGGLIVKTHTRAFNALNQLWKDIGGTAPSTQITQYGYDDNGNLTSITDPRGTVTQNGYDALNRLATVTTDLDHPADPTHGITTTTYNTRDQVTQVQDPRLVTTAYTIDALGDVTLTQSPDSGDTAEVYDAAGNVTQKTDARGVVSNYTYDALNRLTSITYPADSSENVSFAYDDTSTAYYRMGRLAYVLSNNASEALVFTYDAYGNTVMQADITPAIWATSHYAYDAANRLHQITYPDGRIVTYVRNALGQITAVQTQDDASAAAQTVVDSITYEPFGPLASLTFGNGVTTTIQHDADYRVSRITTTANPVWDYVYAYDAAGNLTGLTDQIGNVNKTYGYDALDRLTTDNTTGSFQFGYQYDQGGNRTAFTSSGWPFTLTYASTSNRLTDFANNAYGSDAAGNLTHTYSVDSLSYNNANRLSQATANSTTTTYQYTGLGWRDGKAGAQTVHYDYLPDGRLLSQMQLNTDNTDQQGEDYIWLEDTPIAQVKTTYGANNTATVRRLTYIHADHLNTPRLMTDSTGKVVWRWSSDAFGGFSPPNTDPDGDGVQETLDLRFAGQIADQETGLFYNLNRYYDPIIGRYTQSDPIGLDGGSNTFTYVRGNPLNRVDPEGLFDLTIPLGESGAGNLIRPFPGTIDPTMAPMTSDDGSPVPTSDIQDPATGEKSQCPRPCKGLYDQWKDHERKLREYMSNPDAYDNKGFLTYASPELRQRIINGRIRELKKQIENFRNQYYDCLYKHGWGS